MFFRGTVICASIVVAVAIAVAGINIYALRLLPAGMLNFPVVLGVAVAASALGIGLGLTALWAFTGWNLQNLHEPLLRMKAEDRLAPIKARMAAVADEAPSGVVARQTAGPARGKPPALTASSSGAH